MQANTATAPPRSLRPALAKEYRPELVANRRNAGIHEVVMGFVAFMREQDLCAWMPPDDVRLALEWYCAETRVEMPPDNVFNAALSKAPGVETARKRLASMTGRASLRALVLRAKRDRCELYRIKSVDEMAPPVAKPRAPRRRADEMPERLAA